MGASFQKLHSTNESFPKIKRFSRKNVSQDKDHRQHLDKLYNTLVTKLKNSTERHILHSLLEQLNETTSSNSNSQNVWSTLGKFTQCDKTTFCETCNDMKKNQSTELVNNAEMESICIQLESNYEYCPTSLTSSVFTKEHVLNSNIQTDQIAILDNVNIATGVENEKKIANNTQKEQLVTQVNFQVNIKWENNLDSLTKATNGTSSEVNILCNGDNSSEITPALISPRLPEVSVEKFSHKPASKQDMSSNPPPPPPLPPPVPPQFSPLSMNNISMGAYSHRIRISSSSNGNPRKMKTLNWTKIPPSSITNTVWQKMHINVDSITKHNLRQISLLEDLFVQNCESPSAQTALHNKQANTPEILPKQRRCVNILGRKKSLAVNIFLKQFKKSPEDIVQMLKDGNSISFGLERLQTFVKLLPDEQEIAEIKNYPGEYHTLGDAEKLYQLLVNMHAYKFRVHIMLLEIELPIKKKELSTQLKTMSSVCSAVISHEDFCRFLQLILLLGNNLNEGSYAGNAVGFKLRDFPKLLEIRTKRGSKLYTFLHFVIDIAIEANIITKTTFVNLAFSVEGISRTSLDNIQQELKHLRSEVQDLCSALKYDFPELKCKYKEFLLSSEIDVNDLQILLEKSTHSWHCLAEYLCEDPFKLSFEEGVGLLSNFLHDIQSILSEKRKRLLDVSENEQCETELRKVKFRRLCEE